MQEQYAQHAHPQKAPAHPAQVAVAALPQVQEAYVAPPQVQPA